MSEIFPDLDISKLYSPDDSDRNIDENNAKLYSPGNRPRNIDEDNTDHLSKDVASCNQLNVFGSSTVAPKVLSQVSSLTVKVLSPLTVHANLYRFLNLPVKFVGERLKKYPIDLDDPSLKDKQKYQIYKWIEADSDIEFDFPDKKRSSLIDSSNSDEDLNTFSKEKFPMKMVSHEESLKELKNFRKCPVEDSSESEPVQSDPTVDNLDETKPSNSHTEKERLEEIKHGIFDTKIEVLEEIKSSNSDTKKEACKSEEKSPNDKALSFLCFKSLSEISDVYNNMADMDVMMNGLCASYGVSKLPNSDLSDDFNSNNFHDFLNEDVQSINNSSLSSKMPPNLLVSLEDTLPTASPYINNFDNSVSIQTEVLLKSTRKCQREISSSVEAYHKQSVGEEGGFKETMSILNFGSNSMLDREGGQLASDSSVSRTTGVSILSNYV